MQNLRRAIAEVELFRRLYLPSLAMRWARRETLRLAVRLWTTLRWAARMMTGSAVLNAAIATLGSPLAIASSTLRTELRSNVRRALLISVLRAILRVALRAELVLAMQPLVGDWSLSAEKSAEAPFFERNCNSDKARCHGEAYSKAPRRRQRPQKPHLGYLFGSHRVVA